MSNPVDLIQAIEKINPGADYRLTQSPPPHAILEWRGPGPQPDSAQIYTAWLKCSRIEASTNPFPFASGATVRIYTGEQEQSVNMLVRGQPVAVAISGGIGDFTIAPLEAPTLAPHIVITFADATRYGTAALTLKAV